MERSEAYRRLTRVRDEFLAARASMAYTLRQVWAASINPPLSVTLEQLNLGSKNLEITYVVRLFSEFEGILLDYWQTEMNRSTEPTVRTLIDRIADSRRMSPEQIADAHHVRDFRNDIVHEQLRELRFPMDECGSIL